jgi:uncharacterized repeat protein (TIGR01451 family)
MVPRRAILIAVLVCGIFLSLSAAADQGPLSGNVKAFRVVTHDNGREEYLPADEARPRDVIEYRVTYANRGDETLRNVTVVDPVPAGTEYVGRSATRPYDGSVEFSIDGGRSYHTWPIRIKKTNSDGELVEANANADQVTHIRWIISEDFEPETEITFSYRTVVK